MTTVVSEEYKMTELGPLPPEWEVEPFDNVRVKAIGRIPPSITVTRYQTQGKYPIIDQSANHIAGYTDDDGRVLWEQLPVIIFGDHTRTFKFVNFPFAIGADGTKIIYPNLDAYDPKFLYYYFLSLGIPSRGYNRHFRILREQKIARPPLPEQKKIAYVLSSVQTSIEKTEAVIKALRELKKSMMRHLFTYGPVSMDEVKNVSLKETEIGMVPEKWDVIRLGEVITFSSKPRDLNLSAHDKVPFVPMEYIPDERTNISRYQMKKLEEIKSGTFFFKGNLLVAKITPSFENGKQCIANNLPNDFAYATTEVWPLHETNRADLLYLFYYLKRKDVRADIAGKMEGSTGRQRVPRRVLQSLYIPLPPLQIQKQIAHILSIVDREIEPKENKKEALKALLNTLLKNLMTGKIRVNNVEVPV
jgi:type I restriction enzyme S subunit